MVRKGFWLTLAHKQVVPSMPLLQPLLSNQYPSLASSGLEAVSANPLVWSRLQTRRNTIITPVHIYHPALQRIVSTKTPPSKNPKENPSGCPKPMQAKPTLRVLPRATTLVRIPTEVGKQSATAIPCMARNMINSIPVRARPHASTKQARKKHPVRNTGRLPTTSATAPAVRRHEPLVKL